MRTAAQSFVEHDHAERNHQALSNRIIRPVAGHLGASGAVQRCQRLGGMLNHYCRATARPFGVGVEVRHRIPQGCSGIGGARPVQDWGGYRVNGEIPGELSLVLLGPTSEFSKLHGEM